MPKVQRALGIQRSRVRLATPYLEVESQLGSSLERAISRELEQASPTATREKRERADHLSFQTTLAPAP